MLDIESLVKPLSDLIGSDISLIQRWHSASEWSLSKKSWWNGSKVTVVMDLRETQVSTYVENDIPMIVCVKKDIIPLITSLG